MEEGKKRGKVGVRKLDRCTEKKEKWFITS
jgi:hypothetical protein